MLMISFVSVVTPVNRQSRIDIIQMNFGASLGFTMNEKKEVINYIKTTTYNFTVLISEKLFDVLLVPPLV